MSAGFLACLSPGRPVAIDPAARRALAAAGLAERHAPPHLLLFTRGDMPVRTLAASGEVLIGHAFDGDGLPAPAEPGGVVIAGAEAAARSLWGAFVLLGGGDSEARIYRDPSGGLACYHAGRGGMHVLTSIPALLVDCGLVAPCIDWPAVARSLCRRALREPGTALAGIEEILPGTERVFSLGVSTTRQAWDPLAHACRPSPADPAATLGRALDMALGAWGRSCRRPLVEISGGLDSAIVAAGFAAAAQEAALITFAAGPGDPDETGYARAIAAHLGLPLEIARPRVEEVDLACSLGADLPRPNARAFTQAADALSLRHAQAIGADAFASGGGGDDVFCYLRTILPAIDRLGAEGPRAMAATALDIARMNHSTLWQALALVARRLLRGGSGKPALDASFIARDWIPAAPAPARARRDLPPGKAAHAEGVLTIHNYLEGHARAALAPILSPLLSQPIVEACLAIPTWQWSQDGTNRAVARKAFVGRLPGLVLARRSKGCFDGFCARLLDRNRRLVAELLLDGALAAQGLLDRPAVAAALREPSPAPERVGRILSLVDVEAWARAWSARPGQRG